MWCVVLALWVLLGSEVAGASELIVVPDRSDHVFDATRNVLYISTSSGRIQRYSVRGRRLLHPYKVGRNLRGMDISPDGAWIYATENVHGAARGVLHKVSADTGAVTHIRYALDTGGEGEAGGWDLSIGANGLGLVTTDYFGSGTVPLRTLDLSTDTLTRRHDVGLPGYHRIEERAHLARSADRSIVFMQESNTYDGPISVYDAATDSFTARTTADFVLSNSLAAVSRDVR